MAALLIMSTVCGQKPLLIVWEYVKRRDTCTRSWKWVGPKCEQHAQTPRNCSCVKTRSFSRSLIFGPFLMNEWFRTDSQLLAGFPTTSKQGCVYFPLVHPYVLHARMLRSPLFWKATNGKRLGPHERHKKIQPLLVRSLRSYDISQILDRWSLCIDVTAFWPVIVLFINVFGSSRPTPWLTWARDSKRIDYIKYELPETFFVTYYSFRGLIVGTVWNLFSLQCSH